jgi:hypothetical protein
MVDMAVSMADVVMEEDRTTLVPGWWLRVVSLLHLVTMCLIMDTGPSWVKLFLFMGTNYGHDISNELQNKIPVIL